MTERERLNRQVNIALNTMGFIIAMLFILFVYAIADPNIDLISKL